MQRMQSNRLARFAIVVGKSVDICNVTGSKRASLKVNPDSSTLYDLVPAIKVEDFMSRNGLPNAAPVENKKEEIHEETSAY